MRFRQSGIKRTQFFCKAVFVHGNPPGMQSHRKLDEREINSLLRRSCLPTKRSHSCPDGRLGFRFAGTKRAAERLSGVHAGRAEDRLGEFERAAKRPFGIPILTRGNRCSKDERPGTLGFNDKTGRVQNEAQMKMSIGKQQSRCPLRRMPLTAPPRSLAGRT